MSLLGPIPFLGSKHGTRASRQTETSPGFLPQQVQCLNLELWLQSLSAHSVSSLLPNQSSFAFLHSGRGWGRSAYQIARCHFLLV